MKKSLYVLIMVFVAVLFVFSNLVLAGGLATNAPDSTTVSNASEFIGKWGGYSINMKDGSQVGCRMVIEEKDANTLEVKYHLDSWGRQAPVNDIQNCPVSMRNGKRVFEYVRKAANFQVSYYFYVKDGKLYAEADSASFGDMKYELTRK